MNTCNIKDYLLVRHNLVMFRDEKLSHSKTLLFPCIVTLSRLRDVHHVVAKSDIDNA